MMNRVLPLSAALALAACATTTPPVTGSATAIPVRIVGINDFHGNLEPIRRLYTYTHGDGSAEQVQVGGVAALASLVGNLRGDSPYSLVVSAGDLISASPLVSSLFLDEPTVTAMGRLGLEFSAVGNHEFDRGWRELKRMQDGGCEQLTMRAPCQVEQFAGASFTMLSANVAFAEGGETLFPAAGLKRIEGPEGEVAVGVIGLTLKDTPTLVTPGGVEGLIFSGEAQAINRQVQPLVDQGADAIVVAIHQGLYSDLPPDAPGCEGIRGPLLEILAEIDPRVDLVVSGHTHQTYICDYSTIDPARRFLVTSAGYGGTFVTDIVLTIDPTRGEVIASTARNVLVRSDGASAGAIDQDLAAYVARHAAAAREVSERPVGRIAGEGSKPGPATEETSLGNAIADAQLFATRDAGARIAFMNNSGIRAGLVPGADGTVTFGDIFTVQPFGNQLITRTYSGAQLLALLEQQFDDEGFVQTFSASQGFALTYDMGRAAGARVVGASLDGQSIDPSASYRVTMNSFLAAGGDSFTVFTQGEGSVVGPVDLDAFELWLKQEPVRALPPTGRITDATRR
ncbi:MAG: bifunctional metallophosphatase/5'-nucleotidase [Sphingomonadales bacterium BRH_c42]|nr:MAG: bifunctional metallophosphatase/5'-nucleotidase [Sphingomonadales bacterium BRH_c42]